MTDQHPSTPPPEQVQQWSLGRGYSWNYIATQATRWGADIKLGACCEWAAEQDRGFDLELRAARRPKPKSLAKEALAEIQVMEGAMYSADLGCDFTATRRALERLQQLEENQ